MIVSSLVSKEGEGKLAHLVRRIVPHVPRHTVPVIPGILNSTFLVLVQRRLLSSMSRVYKPSAEDLAKAEARRLKKEQAKKKPAPPIVDERGHILPREWVEISGDSPGHTTRVMTWNVSVCVHIIRSAIIMSICALRFWLRHSSVSARRILI